VLIRRREVDVVRQQLQPFFSVHDRKPGLPPDDLRHQAAVTGVEVLHDDDDRSKPSRQAAEELGQGGDAAGRGGNRDYVKRGFRSNREVQSGARPRPPCISAARIFQ